MRKVSKSRVDDDVISSTNGSVQNEERTETENLAEQKDQEGSEDSDTNEKSIETSEKKDTPKRGKASKNKGNAKKKAEKKSTEEEYEKDSEPEDSEDSDANEKSIETSEKKDTSKRGKVSKNKGNTKKKAEKKNTEEEYEVEKIIDSKKIKGTLHYLVRWKGYDVDDDSWEPANTLSCPDLVNKFHEEKENSKKNGASPSKKNKKRKAKTPTKPTKKPKNEWDSENADVNAEYEVDRILEVHHKKNGQREFLIHWKGWSSKFDSWEPEDNLNCSELIKKFMDKVNVARSSGTRNLRVAPETTNRFTLQDPTTGRRLSKRRGQRQRVRYDNAE